MGTVGEALIILSAILIILGSGVWIYAGLILVSVFSLMVLGDMNLQRVTSIFGSILMRSASSWELAAIPLFVWMGELILKTDLSTRIFRGLRPLVSKLPGGLLHSNVFGCTIFSAISGSSAATTATVGSITINELRKHNYKDSLMIGSLAGSGSLGLLIPPSIVMIVYGVLAEVPIDRLFAAGILPGLLLAGIFSLYVGTYSLIKGDKNDEPHVKTDQKEDQQENYSLLDSFKDLSPVVAIVVLVLGSIYTGLATPSEAAGIGLFSVLIITYLMKSLTWQGFLSSLMSSLQTTIMIFSVIIAASLLTTTLGYLHVPLNLANAVAESDITAGQFIIIISLMFLFLGMILDGVSVIVISLPLLFPMVITLGIDPIWFGIYLVIMVEVGQITPPIGFNLMIIQSISGTPLQRVALYSLPFCILMLIGVAILYFLPEIVLFLPELLFG